jgi:hypothetical protein
VPWELWRRTAASGGWGGGFWMFHNPHGASARGTGLVCDFLVNSQPRAIFFLLFYCTLSSITLVVWPVASNGRIAVAYRGGGLGVQTPPKFRNFDKLPKIKKILLYEIKFLVPNYSCLQNSWLGGHCPHIPVLSVLNWICWTPPPNKIPGYATAGSWMSLKRLEKKPQWPKWRNLALGYDIDIFVNCNWVDTRWQ